MARITPSPLVSKLHGRVGHVQFEYTRFGQVVQQKTIRSTPAKASDLVTRNRFRQAMLNAMMVRTHLQGLSGDLRFNTPKPFWSYWVGAFYLMEKLQKWDLRLTIGRTTVPTNLAIEPSGPDWLLTWDLALPFQNPFNILIWWRPNMTRADWIGNLRFTDNALQQLVFSPLPTTPFYALMIEWGPQNPPYNVIGRGNQLFYP